MVYQIIVVGGELYLEGNSAYWKAQGAAATQANQLQGRWFKGSAAHGNFAVLASILTARTAFKGLLALHGTLKTLPPTHVGGHPVVPVTNAAGSATICIETTGQSYPIKAVARGSTGATIRIDRIMRRVGQRPPCVQCAGQLGRRETQRPAPQSAPPA